MNFPLPVIFTPSSHPLMLWFPSLCFFHYNTLQNAKKFNFLFFLIPTISFPAPFNLDSHHLPLPPSTHTPAMESWSHDRSHDSAHGTRELSWDIRTWNFKLEPLHCVSFTITIYLFIFILPHKQRHKVLNKRRKNDDNSGKEA